MKIREDFVSNSSSTSFVISNDDKSVVNMIEKISKMFDKEYPSYDFESSISIYIRCKNKWHKEIEDFVLSLDGLNEKSDYVDYFEDWKTGQKILKDPEDIGYDSISISLGNLKKLSQNMDLVKKIVSIYFTTVEDNNQSQNRWLKFLFDFFKSINCNPDMTNSERDFEENSSDRFVEIMAKSIAKSEK